jgi:hypothetical protein
MSTGEAFMRKKRFETIEFPEKGSGRNRLRPLPGFHGGIEEELAAIMPMADATILSLYAFP